jgi:hypothetical protein
LERYQILQAYLHGKFIIEKKKGGEGTTRRYNYLNVKKIHEEFRKLADRFPNEES